MKYWPTLVAICAVVMSAGLATYAAFQRPAASPREPSLGNEDACAAYGGVPPDWRVKKDAGMVYVDGGRLSLGAVDGYPEERPLRDVDVPSFWIDRTEVTNAQFAVFVQATGYQTEAEKQGWGVVFRSPKESEEITRDGAWWNVVNGADWRHPDGPSSDLTGRDQHPVVQITRADASAFALWLGRRLPSEEQWEFAAKGSANDERIERGPRRPDGKPSANFWQGMFPYLDVGEDGHIGLAPVGCFPANGRGLHDMIGNAWEWTSSPWSGDHQAHGTGMATRGQPNSSLGLIKGGSFLCSTDYCVRYRSSARHPQELSVPASHIGFRTALDG